MTTDELLQRWSDGSITADELRELTAKLAEPEHQNALLDDWLLEGSLADRLPGASLASLHDSAINHTDERFLSTEERRWSGWFTWRPIAAAAAGLVFGMFCTSVVLAYAQPKSASVMSRTLPLADAGFESGSQVPALGIPVRANVWSGDFSRVVPAENGITPIHGQRMLRFLRSDNELFSKDERSYVGSIAQVIDLRPLRAELSGAEQLVEVSAQFNSILTPPEIRYEFAVKAAAFRGDISDAPRVWEDHEASVSRSNRSVAADSDLTTWQRVAVPLVVPPDADFLVVECAVVRKGPHVEQGAAEFPGHYVDQVEVQLNSSARAWTVARHAK